MCGRYAFFPEDMEPGLRQTIARMNRQERDQLAQGDVHPGDRAAVIVMDGGAPAAKAMRWGMPLPEQKQLVINARAESVPEKGMFAGLMRENRCLLPASLYYEWTRGAAHTRMKVRAGGGLYMAGLCRRSMEAAGEWEFVVLTQPAAGDVERVHDRMPLILPDRDSRRKWLRDERAARAILQSPPEIACSVEVDEPEQMDLFDLMEI